MTPSFLRDLETAVAVAAERRNIDGRMLFVSQMPRLAWRRLGAFTEGEFAVWDQPLVMTHVLPPGWLPARGLKPFLTAAFRLEQMIDPDSYDYAPLPSDHPVVGFVRELTKTATELLTEISTTESAIRDLIDPRVLLPLLREHSQMAAGKAADAAALRTAERRAAFSARLASFLAARESAKTPIPVDPRTLPDSPRIEACCIYAHLPNVIEWARADRKRDRRDYVRRARYRAQVRAALASTEETPRQAHWRSV